MEDNTEKLLRLEQVRAEFNSFISSLRGPDYHMQIRDKYPSMLLTMPKHNDLPDFGPNKVWCCDCGCGEITPILVPFDSFSKITLDGPAKATIEGIWVSPCIERGSEPEQGIRYQSAELWDNETDSPAEPLTRLETF